MTSGYDFDVAVIGGGPAGSCAAAKLARLGRRVVVFERDRFPRFHIGESLLSMANEAFDEIGMRTKMESAGFVEKWGAQFISDCGAIDRYAAFAASPELATPRTWHVPRETFDKLLLDHACEQGAEVREATRVLDAQFDRSGVTVSVASEGDQKSDLRVRAVIDASGRTGFLGQRFALRQAEPGLKNIAIYAHYSGVPRNGEGTKAGDIRLVARKDGGWFWLIPVATDLMSVGVVLPLAEFEKRTDKDPEQVLLAAFADAPAVGELMRTAERTWPVRVERDFSYATRAYAGDRWLLAGDAGSFLDPIFSTGVQIALDSGIEAAYAIDRALRRNRFDASTFRSFEKLQRRRYLAFRRYVTNFYTPSFRDVFFQPGANPALFRAVVTVLGGKWHPSLKARLFGHLFFAVIGIHKRFTLMPRIFTTTKSSEAA